MSSNIFDGILTQRTLFIQKETLRHTHTPERLPHRDAEVETLSFNLVEALKGHIPSNMILYGVTGAGKTAVTRYVCDQLLRKGEQIGRVVHPVLVNCRQIDTQYRVLSHLGNTLLEAHEEADIPFTGWPTDRVFSELVKRMDERGGVYVIVLDEIDHLVKKAGDDLLYNLTNLNAELKNARACVIGISNDLKFTDFLDPRVRSRLGQEDIIFNPYNAEQLQDILRGRAQNAITPDAIGDGVIELCAALAAQENGDARCALDLLRVSTEKAEQEGVSIVEQQHVRIAQAQIESDQVTPVIRTLPTQQKMVLVSVLINENNGLRNIQTGEVYHIYKQACNLVGQQFLTARRISGIINNLDMLGLITAKVISRGRHGRSKEINSCIPNNIDPIDVMAKAEPVFSEIFANRFRHQSRL
ncbi:MAG: orc1/cdc6 family replication initiation protein [Candidatus Poseidoniaceae archaeon]|jgi:cell division control protein 6|nr:orc1/cdc6 family replication initiation protein [Candidatus Poseidoniaceae archaeon]